MLVEAVHFLFVLFLLGILPEGQYSQFIQTLIELGLFLVPPTPVIGGIAMLLFLHDVKHGAFELEFLRMLPAKLGVPILISELQKHHLILIQVGGHPPFHFAPDLMLLLLRPHIQSKDWRHYTN